MVSPFCKSYRLLHFVLRRDIIAIVSQQVPHKIIELATLIEIKSGAMFLKKIKTHPMVNNILPLPKVLSFFLFSIVAYENE